MPDFAQMDFATVFWTMLPFIAVGFAAQMVD
ncbi:MAG: sulfite exporter TauE/SafE family protein, partial [Lysobacteraceae bacterium]